MGGTEDARNSYHFIASGQSALPVDSLGNPWTGQNVFSSGNLKLDLLHNFFLECGARANKIRVYEMVDDPTARAAVGYLLVRGGVHIVAYARALEKLTGARPAGGAAAHGARHRPGVPRRGGQALVPLSADLA